METEPKFRLDEDTAQNTSPATAGLPAKPTRRQASRRVALVLKAGERPECGLQVFGW